MTHTTSGPPVGTRKNYLPLHNTLSFIKTITNKALKHHWIRNDLPLKSKRSDFKKGEIELLKELHINLQAGESQDITKFKVNHYHKHL